MAIPQWIISIAVSLLFLAIAFIPMEKAFPAKKHQKTFRPFWLTDFLFFLGQFLLWNGLVFWVLNYFNTWLHGLIPSTFRAGVAAQPFLIQTVEVIFFSDLLIYWAHRLQHNLPFLWRFHKVHHSAEHLDWLAAYREHPLDTIYTVGLINLPAFVLGFPLETLIGVIAFRGIWAVYIHSNVRFRLGFLKKIIGSPELHHWHHARDQHAGNYANISPLMDIIFGTYVCPNHEPKHFGIQEPFPKSYFAQLLVPVLPGKWMKKWPKLPKKQNEVT